MQGLQWDTVTMETETTGRCRDYMGIQGLQGDTGTTRGYREIWGTTGGNRDYRGILRLDGDTVTTGGYREI